MAIIFSTITEPDLDGALRVISELPRERDLGVEFRADFPGGGGLSLEALRAVRQASKGRTLLFTMRTPSGDPRPVDHDLSNLALEAGFDLIDVEWGADVDPSWLRDIADRVVLSHHDSGAPALAELDSAMREAGTRFVKIVGVPATQAEDFELAAYQMEQARSGRRDLSVFGMGPVGGYSRMAAPRLGAALTFAFAGDRAGAPGQLSVARALECGLDVDLVARHVFALIGSPASHSGSPPIHNARFDELGLAATYSIIETEDPRFVLDALESGRKGAPSGLSVTTPHKDFVFEEAIRRGWNVSDEARRTEAVNTVVTARGAVVADNTDVSGFSVLLAKHEAEGPCVVLGAGPTARSAWAAASDAGLRPMLGARASARGLRSADLLETELTPFESLPHEVGTVLDCLPPGVAARLFRPAVARLWIESSYSGDGVESLDGAPGGATILNGRVLLEAQAERQSALFVSSIMEGQE